MDIGTIRGLITVLTMITFLAICWWAYRSANRKRFEEDAWLPFREEGGGASSGGRSGRTREGGSDE